MEILFATDGRSPALAAGDLLRRLVDPSHVEIAVLSAHDPSTETTEGYFDTLLEEAERAMSEAGLTSRSVWREGDPAVCIEKELAGDGYGLVIVGAGNHSWLGHIAFGSVATCVLHRAPVPVVVVHRGPSQAHDRLKVLVGADGSPAATHAIDTLASLTEPDCVDLRVRTVIRTHDIVLSHSGTYVPTPYTQKVLEEEEAIASRHLEGALDRLRIAGFSARGSIGSGWPANDLLDQAERGEADLVVLGARGAGTLERMTMGSVSAHVARYAPATLVAQP